MSGVELPGVRVARWPLHQLGRPFPPAASYGIWRLVHHYHYGVEQPPSHLRISLISGDPQPQVGALRLGDRRGQDDAHLACTDLRGDMATGEPYDASPLW